MTSPETALPLLSLAMRKIIHIDMDAFYASVEQHDHPELRGKPIAVGGTEHRGVVCAASYEARRFGVRSAMTGALARKRCPHITFVAPRFPRYKEVSQAIHAIFHDYTDCIEPISLDEAFLDVTENKIGEPLAVEIARQIRRRIRDELGLTASAGVSYNKFLAKVASDARKPDGLCTVHPDQALDFIATLPIEAFWGVGRATAKRMHELGISTGADLRERSLEELRRRFGKAGQVFYDFARGIDDRPVVSEWVRKSFGCEHTFDEDSAEPLEVEARLRLVAEELQRRLERKGFVGRTLTLKVKFSDFTSLTRSTSDLEPISSLEGILRLGLRLLRGLDYSDRPIRLLGLSLSNPPEEQRPGMWVPQWLPLVDAEGRPIVFD